MLNGIALSRNGEIRVTTSELVRDITAPPPPDFELTDEHVDRMLGAIRGIEPRSIEPNRKAMKRGDMGRGRGNTGDSQD